MKFKAILTTAAIALLPVISNAATIVVPAAGTGAGANGSQWQSELTLHTAAPRDVALSLTFHQGTNVLGPVDITLHARETISIADVVKTKFGVDSGTGAVVVDVNDRDARTLAITSRTFNVSADGEFGQDIPAVSTDDAARAGDIAALNGPSVAESTRFNFGIYAVTAANVKWEVMRADGTVAATKDVAYAAGQHAQYNGGIQQFLGVTAADNDTVNARIGEGKVIVYGSVVNATGDPSFVPGVRTRDDILINFAGLDLDENGTVDVADANHDGVLDAPIEVITSRFPSYFRLVAAGEFGEDVTYEIVSSPALADLLDARGTMRVVASGDVKGSEGEILVRATAGGSSTIITIPVKFR